ncbi:MAG: type II secretion system F family protein, partial [Candidatus Contendobacter sp.]|nr:type II secretion system F family protein [Candidatus Contendobacter sp.]
MPAFQYAALDAKGRQRKGLIEADTPRLARQALRERGLNPLGVEEIASQEQRRGRQWWRGRVRIGATDLALVTRQLATLAGSGLPLEEALGAVARQADRARLGGLLLAVRTRVLEGHALATALGDFPQAFPELYRATVAAGEQSGHLDVVFERLADYTEARQQMRQKVGLALFYPLLLTGVAILIVAGLLTYVVPQVVQVFGSLHQQLPALTRGLIALSDFLRQYGWVVLVALAGGVVAWLRALRRIGFKRRVHQVLLQLPLIGRLARGINTARFARTFSILMASGVP